MSELSKRSTIYFEPELYRALRIKASSTSTTRSGEKTVLVVKIGHRREVYTNR